MIIKNLYSAGFVHWGLQRSSALTLISLIFTIFCCYFLGFEVLYLSYLILIIFVFHFKLGFETLIEDYIHNVNLKIFAKVLVRFIGIYVLKFVFFIATLI
jgi:succinate dehydrogenase hydrophobic anchor subunit